MKQNKLIQIAVVSVSLLLIGMAVAPTTHATIRENVLQHEISTEFLGMAGKETRILFSNTDFESIKTILRNLEYDLEAASTNEQAGLLVEDTFDELYTYGLFGNIDITFFKELCTRQYRFLPNVEIPKNIDNHFGNIGGDNAFCLLLSHIKGYVYDHGLLFVLALLVALSALPFIIIFYPLGAIFNLISEQIFALQHKKPFIPPFPHRVETRYNESYSNLISRGLYGRVNNDYTNWGFRFDAFTGVRTNIDRDEALRINESYYLGSALFVSWNYDGPH